MKKLLFVAVLISISFISSAPKQSEAKQSKKEVTGCVDPYWTTEDECKQANGKYVVPNSECEEEDINWGVKEDTSGQVCCASCTSFRN